MKTRKERPQQDSGEAPVTFHDIAACFSKEEWKLLHEWQKDLYRNVMKEIHQALISLGPVIATSVFSLRAKEKEDLYPADHQDSETRRGNNNVQSADTSNSDVFTTREENHYLEDAQVTDRRESSNLLRTGFPSLNSDLISRVEQAVEVSLDGHEAKARERIISPHSGDTNDNSDVLFSVKGDENQGADRRESSDCLSTGHEAIMPIISFKINKEGESYATAHQSSERRGNLRRSTGSRSTSTELEGRFMDHIAAEGGQSSTSVGSEQEVIRPVVSFIIKEEGDAFFMDNQESERKKNLNNSIAVNASVNSTEQLQASSWERTATSSECGRRFSQKLDVINHHIIKPGEAPYVGPEYDSSLGPGSNPVKRKGTHKRHRPFTWNECWKSFSTSSSSLIPHPEIQAGLKLYICSQCGNSFHRSEHETGQDRITKGEQQNTCSECEKSFQQSTNLTTAQEKDMEEKPHICTECGKRFRKSQSLMIHQRVHTGEKPYTCSQCGKDFRQLPHLVKHQRMHTGEKPYICNVCEKGFINSSNLKRHLQIHARELDLVNWTADD